MEICLKKGTLGTMIHTFLNCKKRVKSNDQLIEFDTKHHEEYFSILSGLTDFVDFQNEMFHFHGKFKKKDSNQFGYWKKEVKNALDYFKDLLDLYEKHAEYYYSTAYFIDLYRVRTNSHMSGYPLWFKSYDESEKRYFYTNRQTITHDVLKIWKHERESKGCKRWRRGVVIKQDNRPKDFYNEYISNIDIPCDDIIKFNLYTDDYLQKYHPELFI